MSARSILILSLGLNLALTAWIAAKLHRAPAASIRAAGAVEETTPARPDPAWRVRRTNVIEVTTNRVDAPGFRWSQLETNDFEAYVANLHGIGCPGHTVRHLVVGEVEALYEGREAEIERTGSFWETASQRRSREARAHRAQAALEEEKRALLRRLVGVDWSAKAEREWSTDDYLCLVIGFLTDDQAVRLVHAAMSLEKRTRAFRDETDGIVIDTDEPNLEALLVEAKRELESGLTPAEVEEATLRGVNVLKMFMGSDSLAGVSLTGDELRRLTAMAARDKDFITVALRSELEGSRHGRKTEMEDLVKEVSPMAEREIRAMLGESRLAAYDRSKDPAFREFAGTARQLNLPLDSTVKAWEIRHAAETAARELKALEGIGSRERRAALEAMRRETEQAIKMAVGAEAVKEFFREDRGWALKAFGAKEAKR